MVGKQGKFGFIKSVLVALCLGFVTSFAYSDGGYTYNCGQNGTFPMRFAGCTPGYYYENWKTTNINNSLTPSNVGSCIECLPGYVCAGGLAGPAEPKFTLTTTSSTDSFQFKMTAVGTFIADCGDGGTLTSTAESNDVTNNYTITRSTSVEVTYTCSWGTAGAHMIRFYGEATGYSNYETSAAIRFNITNSVSDTNAPKIASVSGNLSEMFPYKTANAQNGAQPRFYNTFWKATNLTSIPETLFADYTTPATKMFYGAFRGCTGLTSISSGLFQVTGAATDLFYQTFSGCSNLASITDGQTSTSYVPGSFIRTVADGSDTKSARNMFTNTALASSCPSGTEDVTPTQFDNAGKPWCSSATYTVSFNSNGTIGGQSAAVTATYGEAMPRISSTKPRCMAQMGGPNQVFVGWFDANGTKYYDSSCNSARTYDQTSGITLYATCVPYYTITLDANGGTSGSLTNMYAVPNGNYRIASGIYFDVINSQTYAAGEFMDDYGTLPVRTGYGFDGFGSTASGGTTYVDATGEVTATLDTRAKNATADFTIYAKWTANTITIKWMGVKTPVEGFEPVNGEPNAYTSQVPYDGNIVTPVAAVVSSAGQTFLGWKFVKPAQQ